MIFSDVKCFLLDLDGTVYLGGRLLPGAAAAVAALRRRGKRVIYLTNNSSASRGDYSLKLCRMGLDAPPSDVYTAGNAAADYLTELGVKRCYVLGTPRLKAEFAAAGIRHSDAADTVVIGFDTSLTYKKLDRACSLIRDGARFVATHPDLNCPIEGGYMPDAGSITALVTASTGRAPDVVCGKPYPPMARGVLRLTCCEAALTAMVGDRLSTDIAFGAAAGMKTALVLTGEATRGDYEKSGLAADAVLASIAGLPELI